MVRRLSITVPDELWDNLTHLDPSPSSLVQRALRCLRDTEGLGDERTPLEVAAAEKSGWDDVLAMLTDEAAERRAEGYQAVFTALTEGNIGLWDLELVVQQYSIDEVPRMISESANRFLSQRQNQDDDRSSRYYQGGLDLQDWLHLVGQPSKVPSDWEEYHGGFYDTICRIIVAQPDGLLRTNANGNSFRLTSDEWPTVDIPLSLYEGMAAAFFDIVATVRRKVRTERSPEDLGTWIS